MSEFSEDMLQGLSTRNRRILALGVRGGADDDGGQGSEGEGGDDESVLDLEGAGDGDAGEDGGGDGGGEGGDASVDVEALADTLEARLGARFDAIADRRVNALLKEMRKQGGGDQGQGSESGEQQQSDQPTVDVRGARLAFREYLSDEVRFLGADERAFAMDLGALVVAANPNGLTDEDQLGREAAALVKAKVNELRSMYEKATKAGLKRRGMLKDQPGGEQPPRGPGSVGAASEFDKGAEKAQAMFASASGA